MTEQQAILRDPEIMSGAVCLAGTLVPFGNLCDYLEGGNGIDYFLESFNWVSREQVLAVRPDLVARKVQDLEVREEIQLGEC
jgi:uncharacterized protein (DUF433 family)